MVYGLFMAYYACPVNSGHIGHVCMSARNKIIINLWWRCRCLLSSIPLKAEDISQPNWKCWPTQEESSAQWRKAAWRKAARWQARWQVTWRVQKFPILHRLQISRKHSVDGDTMLSYARPAVIGGLIWAPPVPTAEHRSSLERAVW